MLVFILVPAASAILAVESSRSAEARAAFQRGESLYGRGQFAPAEAAFSDAIVADPNFADAYRRRGNCRNQLRKYTSAVEDFNRALQLDPRNAKAYMGRGNARRALKDFPNALADLDRAAALDPYDPKVFYNRAAVRSLAGDAEGALADFESALGLADESDRRFLADAHAGIADSQLKLENYAAARAAADRALALNPDNVVATFTRAQVFQALGDRSAAARDYRRTLELDPRHPLATKRLELLGGEQAASAGPSKPPAAEGKTADQALTRPSPSRTDAKPAPPRPSVPVGESAARTVPADATAATPPPTRPVADTFEPPPAPPLAPPPALPGTEDIDKLPARFPPPPAQPPRFPADAPCDGAYWTWAGVPWKPAPVKPAASAAQPAGDPVKPFDFDDYSLQATRAMESVRRVYGAMSPEQSKYFESLWAPFFDFPNAPDYDYFVKLNPLLAQYLWVTARLSGTEPAFEESMQDAAIAAGLGNVNATRAAVDAAAGQARSMHDLTQQLQTVLADLNRLGDPPNPLAEKCHARSRHRQAIQALLPAGLEGEWIGEWHNLIDRYPLPKTERCRQMRASSTEAFSGSATAVSLPGRIFHTAFSRGDMKAFASRFPGVTGEAYVLYNYDRISLDEAHQRDVRRDESGRVVSTLADGIHLTYTSHCWWRFRTVVFPPLVKGPDGVYRQRWYYGTKRNIDQTIEIRVTGDQMTLDWIGQMGRTEEGAPPGGEGWVSDPPGTYIFHLQARAHRALPSEARGRPTAPDKERFGGSNYDLLPLDGGTVAAAPPAAPAPAAPQPAPPAEDAQAKAEAIAQYQAEIRIIQANIAWLQGQQAAARSDKARKELQDCLDWEEHVLRKTQDLAASVQTGTIVHTRTALDEKTNREFVAKVQDEIAAIAAENQILNRLSRVAGQVDGAEGVALRESVQARISGALKSPDRLAALQQIAGEISARLQAQGDRELARAQERLDTAERRLAIAEGVKTAADAGILVGAFFVTGGSAIPLWYGLGTGYAEGGLAKAFENGIRSYSATVDTLWAGVNGFKSVDPATGKQRGWWGAISDGGTTLVLNNIHRVYRGGGPAPAGSTKPPTKPKPGPEFDAFLDNAQRMERDLQRVRQQFEPKMPKRPDGSIDTADPAYAPLKAQMDQAMAPVTNRYKIIVQRQQAKAEMAELTRKYEDMIPPGSRHPDGTPKTDDPRYLEIKQRWEGEMKAVRDKYKPLEKRQSRHEEVMRKLGLTEGDIKSSGGAPETIFSDMDLMASDIQKGRVYVNAISPNALEFPDRWVIPELDITVWKPVRRETLGSSTDAARVWYDTEIGSDKFPTPGGIFDTSGGMGGFYDPRGAVIANWKKASEAGINTFMSKPDLHVIGKSVDKAIGIANRTAGKPLIQDREFTRKAYAVRKHATPEEAGIVTFGNPPAAKAEETRQFLDKASNHMAEAYRISAVNSEAVDKARQYRLVKFLEKGLKEDARKIREEQIQIRVANETALQALGMQDPKVTAQICAAPGAVVPQAPPPAPSTHGGVGWLWTGLTAGPPAAGAPQPPAAALPATHKSLADRSARLAKALDTQVLPGLAKDSPDRAQLVRLKSALERAAAQPRRGLLELRQLTGYDAAQVLKDLEAALPSPPAP
ncbi:MAG TPA: hypothetical protein PLN27_13770 [Acidobacteriota bacterium]|nr:hypothetical protein [Acidobacteriota bacterium]